MSDELKVIVVNESAFQSIISDTYTFAVLFGGFWVNHEFIGGNALLNLVLAVCFFIWLCNRAINKKLRKMNLKEAKEYFAAGKTQ